jgi:glucose/arabinose dehydrogenase
MHRAAGLALALLLAACAGNPTSSVSGAAAVSLLPTASESTLLPQPSTPGPSGTVPARFDPGTVHVDLVPFAKGLDNPDYVTGTGDGSGRLLALEQAGRIRIIGTDGDVATRPFLDIRDRIISGGNQGLLGLALHPDFAENGRLFVDYTRKPDGATIVSEFHAKQNTADPASERIVLTFPDAFVNHNGGMLAFDSTGMLVIGMGDGAKGGDPQGNAQNREMLLGKLLRIDVDGQKPYDLPQDNPFLRAANTLPEIWDVGLRNPWRFSFDRQTGDLFIGDVGQSAWEEIDAERADSGGMNYGWNVMEGRHCLAEGCDTSGLTLPVAEYGHDDETSSVIGGYVYRGSRFPQLAGGYLFSDYARGTIWALAAAEALANGAAVPAVMGSAGFFVSSFGQDDMGELYVVDLGGRILKVVATSNN